MILPVFPSGNKVNPPPMAMPSDFNLAITTQVNGVQPALIDFLWILARMCPSGDVGHPTAVKEDAQSVVEESQLQVVPAWTAFNSLLCKESTPPRSTVAYCPVISASPTDSATVYALLSQSVSMTRKAELPFCVIVLDQAIYAKATDIVLQRASEFSDVVLRMGGFHICMTLLAIIGKRFSDGGLLNLLVEADVAGSSTAGLALSGKQYNRAVRFHKLVYEALQRLRWRSFIDHLCDSRPEWLSTLQIKSGLLELRNFISLDNASQLLGSKDFQQLWQEYDKFCCQRNNASAMFCFWSSYIDLVGLLLMFIRSMRIGSWQLHLQCIGRILPWCFAYNRHNYARYMSLY
eukprot:scpid6312/ scgid28153/ 